MKTILKIVTDTTWYRQFVYGGILAVLFTFLTVFSGFHMFWAVAIISGIAGLREFYNQQYTGAFSWRNFFFLLIPVILVSFLF